MANAEIKGFQNDLRYLTGVGPEQLVLSLLLITIKNTDGIGNHAQRFINRLLWPIKEYPWLNFWLAQQVTL